MEEVAQHKAKNDVWLAIDGKVYDVTEFLSEHPGGKGAPLVFALAGRSKRFLLDV